MVLVWFDIPMAVCLLVAHPHNKKMKDLKELVFIHRDAMLLVLLVLSSKKTLESVPTELIATMQIHL